jgi:hypothetical protein
MYYETFRQVKKMLGQLDTWLVKADEYARAKSFDPNVFLTLRLAPDQFAFARQVQAACDTAKLAASRLSGKEAPVHADNEQTLADLRTRVQAVIAYLDGFEPQDFADAASRVISHPRWGGKSMSGAAYFLEHGLPNIFFHSTHVYAILRHNGVNLGKGDFLGPLTYLPA